MEFYVEVCGVVWRGCLEGYLVWIICDCVIKIIFEVCDSLMFGCEIFFFWVFLEGILRF